MYQTRRAGKKTKNRKTIEQSRVHEGSPMDGARIYGEKNLWKRWYPVDGWYYQFLSAFSADSSHCVPTISSLETL